MWSSGNSLNAAWDESIRVCGAHDRDMCRKYNKTNRSEEERDFWNWLECVLLKLEGFVRVCSHNIEQWLNPGTEVKMLLEDVLQNCKIKDGKILSVRYNT